MTSATVVSGLDQPANGHLRARDTEDLNQVALTGLLMAIERFDPGRGTELTAGEGI